MEAGGIEESLISLHEAGLNRDFRREALFTFVKRALSANGRCLDVGCGTGFMVERIADLRINVVGIDSSEMLIEHARRRLEVKSSSAELYVSDIQNIPQYGKFDLVLCLDVIEHLEHDREALSLLRQACLPDGKLILSVPALSHLYGERDVMLGHFRRYDKKELLSKMTESGFKVHSCQFWNMIGVPAYWFSERVLKRSINDGLRTGHDSGSKRLMRLVLERWLSAEFKCPFLPWGLSLVCVSSVQ